MNIQAPSQPAYLFDSNSLLLDAEAETQRITNALVYTVREVLRRQGAVVGISGGIDSSVVLALCVRAFGPDHVVGLLLPERESSPESAVLAQQLADGYGVRTITEDITAALEGLGCYRRRNEAIQRIFPSFGPGWRTKIVLPGSLLERGDLNVFSLVVISPTGEEFRKRLPLADYRQIVAASNYKQRTRMAMLYYHAELRNYAVVGTANKNEHDLGFFVKHGDAGTDIQPILHLFKSQVYQLARYLDVPATIQTREPTSDTYSAATSQEEFFFRVPFAVLDSIWLGHERGVPASDISAALSLSEEQVKRVIADIGQKQRLAAALQLHPVTVPECDERTSQGRKDLGL